jgi:hypothetical protein
LNVPAGEAAGPRPAAPRALRRKAVGQPIGFASDVVIDVPESEAFEPPRGPRAEVSLVVPAVDDDGPASVELGSGLSLQLLERDADRARQVLLLV